MRNRSGNAVYFSVAQVHADGRIIWRHWAKQSL